MTPIWFTNLSIIYEKKYIFEVVPHKSFDLNKFHLKEFPKDLPK